jgi:hypothetical protein
MACIVWQIVGGGYLSNAAVVHVIVLICIWGGADASSSRASLPVADMRPRYQY